MALSHFRLVLRTRSNIVLKQTNLYVMIMCNNYFKCRCLLPPLRFLARRNRETVRGAKFKSPNSPTQRGRQREPTQMDNCLRNTCISIRSIPSACCHVGSIIALKYVSLKPHSEFKGGENEIGIFETFWRGSNSYFENTGLMRGIKFVAVVLDSTNTWKIN